jgi:hypothetical protein
LRQISQLNGFTAIFLGPGATPSVDAPSKALQIGLAELY